MRRTLNSLLLGSSILLSAQSPAEGPHWSTEVDLLPLATGGWYTSLAMGRNSMRVRAVASEVHVPDAFSPKGWIDARIRAQALLVDRFFRPEFNGPWVGAGLEHWDELLKRENGMEPVRLKSFQATLGAGWVFNPGKGWTLNPWMAMHQRISGDREASIGRVVCRPRAVQVEASLKVGYSFN